MRNFILLNCKFWIGTESNKILASKNYFYDKYHKRRKNLAKFNINLFCDFESLKVLYVVALFDLIAYSDHHMKYRREKFKRKIAEHDLEGVKQFGAHQEYIYSGC